MLEFVHADHTAGEFVECLPGGAGSFIALDNPSEVGEPRHGAFNNVSNFPKPAAVDRLRISLLLSRRQQRDNVALDDLPDDVHESVAGVTTTMPGL